MKILFLTLVKIGSLEERGIYQDLLRKFRNEGHEVFIVTPIERRESKNTNVKTENNTSILEVKSLNIQKTNILEKGIGTLAIEYQYLAAIKKYFNNVKFDLILYSTPPITFSKIIQFIKKRDKAVSYLLLKDIFPQNAVDMKMLKENGLLHLMFKRKEKKLYRLSDYIGCMSEANKTYILKHNPKLNPHKVEVNPNTIEPCFKDLSEEEKLRLKEKYKLPLNKKIFVYGGNLGKPQGLDFLLETIKEIEEENAFFIVVGSGTEYNRILNWFQENKPANAALVSNLPKEEYDKLLRVCDVGLIFLHKDFTIPNFPSRLLSYLEMSMPVIAATDANTDIGRVIEKNNCGYSILSGDRLGMQNAINELVSDEYNFTQMQKNAWNLLQREYKVDISYQLIKNKLDNV